MHCTRRESKPDALALEIRDIAARVGDGAVCTSGGVFCKPGIVTSVVETAEQLAMLRDLGCDEAQGFHLHRPLPAEKLSALLQQAPLLLTQAA